MKILFITGLYPKEQKSLLSALAHGIMQNACDAYQWAVVKGLAENEADFNVLSLPYLPCFPRRFKRLFTPSSDIFYKGNKIGDAVSYCALPVFKDYSQDWQVKRYVGKWIKDNIKDSDERFAILTYTPDQYIRLLASFKKRYPKLIISSIVTDLVDDVMNFSSNRSFLKRIQMSRLTKEVKSSYRHIDKFVLLTEAMKKKIPEAHEKSIIVEGISSAECSSFNAKESNSHRTLLYTGSLQLFAGIRDLVDAFMMTTDDSFRLVICGSGECAEYIKECASRDSRISFLGSVSRDEALDLQKKATSLINPRKPNGGITKYSFPSKTMEYLSSGTPMIGYRLEGIPDEYFEHMYTEESLDIQALADKITEVLSKPQNELDQKATAAMKFIVENKTSKIQVRKIMDFLAQTSIRI